MSNKSKQTKVDHDRKQMKDSPTAYELYNMNQPHIE